MSPAPPPHGLPVAWDDSVNHVAVCAVERRQIQLSRETRLPLGQRSCTPGRTGVVAASSRGRQVEVVDAVLIDVAQRLGTVAWTVRVSRDP